MQPEGSLGGEQAAVDGRELASDRAAVAACGGGGSALGEGSPPRLVPKELRERVRQRLRICRRDEAGAAGVADEIRVTLDATREDWSSRRHRLEQHEPEAFAADGRRAH